ncbi:MAG: class I SAM-dependent methyltransferase [Rhizomicrobium sp.]
MSVLNDPGLEALLAALHEESDGQSGAMRAYFERRAKDGTLSWDRFDAETDRFFADKMVALEKDKAEFCYALCRALRARRVVEAGTSYGVSTLYLAAAVRDTAGLMPRSDGPSNNAGGTVIATEYEPAKAKAARANFAAAGLSAFVDLREGDLRETLKDLEGPIDFLLCDIWTELAAPALALIAPHMRPGAIAVADNTDTYRRQYADYFAGLAANGFTTLTLPFDGGLEMSVKG